jgi:hypothetical protein
MRCFCVTALKDCLDVLPFLIGICLFISQFDIAAAGNVSFHDFFIASLLLCCTKMRQRNSKVINADPMADAVQYCRPLKKHIAVEAYSRSFKHQGRLNMRELFAMRRRGTLP